MTGRGWSLQAGEACGKVPLVLPSPCSLYLVWLGGIGRLLREVVLLPFLPGPGCRPWCYSSGLEPSLGMAAARTPQAVRRR